MELICTVCGPIAIWVSRDHVAKFTKEHVEGRLDPKRPRVAQQYPPHPGHIVTAKPDANPSPFSLPVRRREAK